MNTNREGIHANCAGQTITQSVKSRNKPADSFSPPNKKRHQSRNKPGVEQGKTEQHLRTTWTRKTLADSEEFLILSQHVKKQAIYGTRHVWLAGWCYSTVCSSTHFSFPPFPSTNLPWKIWKCTGGPPNAVNPRSHVRRKTSIMRRERELRPSFRRDWAWLDHLRFKDWMDRRYCERGAGSSILQTSLSVGARS